jgi:2-oxo-3-hexenedioate decarboxylase
VLKHPLSGPGCHIGSVLAATDFIVPAIEIIDSRYRDFKFDLTSVIADNCSSSRFVVGGSMTPVAGLDLRTLGVVLEKNGQVAALGAGAAVLNHPATAVAMLANHLGARGESLPAGALILSGGITEAVAVSPGDHVSLRSLRRLTWLDTFCRSTKPSPPHFHVVWLTLFSEVYHYFGYNMYYSGLHTHNH